MIKHCGFCDSELSKSDDGKFWCINLACKHSFIIFYNEFKIINIYFNVEDLSEGNFCKEHSPFSILDTEIIFRKNKNIMRIATKIDLNDREFKDILIEIKEIILDYLLFE